jgi:2-aminoethylphosphonate-pyruvate transaminase
MRAIILAAGRGMRLQQEEIRERLLATYDLDPEVWTAVLMTGSGTAAVESMTAALVPANGRLNDLTPLSKLCNERGLGLLVDGVSSFGAEVIDFPDGSLHAVAATANKCLHGVPGASFVIARRTALAQAASRTYYLDLGRLARMQDKRNTPFTPAVHAYYALVEALREFADEGGRAARFKRYAALAEQVRAGLAELGINPVIGPEQSSVVLRSYTLPAGTPYTELHDALKAEGFVIYAGQGDLSKTLFRISTMGAVTSADMNRLLKCFAQRV